MRYQIGKKQLGVMTVVRGDGAVVAELDKRFLSEKGRAVIEGVGWTYGKEFGGPLTATSEADPAQRLEASRPSLMRQGWEVTGGSANYQIKPAGMFSFQYNVLRNGQPVGTSGRGSFWTNKPFIELPEDVPVAEAVFLLWVAFLMRGRASAAAANAGN